MEVGPVIPTIAARAVHDVFVGGVVAVLAAIDMEARAIERRQARRTAQPLGRRGRHAPLEGRNVIRIERISRPTKGIII
jgi:hypothetical protein